MTAKETEFPITLNTPWFQGTINTHIQMICVFRGQLNYFLRTRASPDPEFTKAERDAYQEVIDLNCEITAGRFIRLKGDARAKGEPLTSVEAIAQMKLKNQWGPIH